MGLSWALLSSRQRACLTRIATAATNGTVGSSADVEASDVGVLLWALVKMDSPINDLPLDLRIRLFESLGPS